jgi:hypothetical protein
MKSMRLHPFAFMLGRATHKTARRGNVPIRFDKRPLFSPERFPALALVLLAAPYAHADVAEDARRLADDWAGRSAQVERLSPIFTEHGQTRIVRIAPNPAVDAKPGCVTVAFVGAQTVQFSAAPMRDGVPLELLPLPEGHPGGAREGDGVFSSLGVATISRCNEERSQLEHLVISMRSARGAIDTVVGRSAAPLGDARDVLTERVTGVVAPRGNPGRPIEPGPMPERVLQAEERARIEGAQTFVRVATVSSADGLGQTRLRLTEGCHRITVMGTVPQTFPHRATDIDAEARNEDGEVLAQDRSETPDARLDFCLGTTSRVTIVFGGAAGPVPIMVSDAGWSIPDTIPNHWGSRVRAGFAQAFLRRHLPAPASLPSAEVLGSSGTTMIPIALEPGRCYFAAAAVLRGEPRSIRVSATIADKFVREDAVDQPEGTGVTLCANRSETARIDVDARGNNVFWIFALFPFVGGNP